MVSKLFSEIQRFQKLEFFDFDDVWDMLLVDVNGSSKLKNDTCKVFTLGSCFAKNLANKMISMGLNAKFSPITETYNTPLVNLAIIESAVLGPANSKYYKSIDRFFVNKEIISRIKEDISQAGIIVFTVGVGFVWRKKETKEVYFAPDWKTPSFYTQFESFFPPPQFQADNLLEIVRLIRMINQDAEIYLTLSPVPIEFSFEYKSAILSDCVSKSMLRSAIHLLQTRNLEGVQYFPSFEFVRWCGSHFDRKFYGADGKVRHVDDDLIEIIVQRFLKLNGHS